MPNGVVVYEVVADLLARYGEPALRAMIVGLFLTVMGFNLVGVLCLLGLVVLLVLAYRQDRKRDEHV